MRRFLTYLMLMCSGVLSAQEEMSRLELSSDFLGYFSQRMLVLESDDSTEKKQKEVIESFEVPAFLIQFGLFASYRVAPRWKIKSGLNYAVRGENMVETETHSLVQNPGIKKYTRTNFRNHRLELPLLAQWELIPKKNKHGLFIALGPFLSFNLASRLVTLNYSDKEKERHVSKDTYIRKFIVLGHLAIGYSYQWSEHWGFQTQAVIQHALMNNINIENTVLKAYPQGLGLSVGVVYRVKSRN